jgi:DNA ligase-associated metallophosphoesterase
MTPAPLAFAGQHLLLDPSGAAFWPARRSLIVADLHLEKASSYAARGALLPPYDSRVTLEALARLVRHYAPERIIALGDSFHDSDGAKRLCREDRAALDGIMARAAFVWITGNHDPLMPAEMPGIATGRFEEAGLKFRHIAAPRTHLVSDCHGEISGHYHPKARVAARGRTISRRCFIADAHRLMLPALGAYSGGLDVTAPPVRALFPHGARVFLLGADRIFAFTLPDHEMESA